MNTQDKIDHLKSIIASLEVIQEKKEEPKPLTGRVIDASTLEIGQDVWRLAAFGVMQEVWSDTNYDNDALQRGNVFYDQASAELEDLSNIATQKLRGMTKGFVPDWSNEEQRKYYGDYAHEHKKWIRDYQTTYQQQGNTVYFATHEDREQAYASLAYDEINSLRGVK